MKRGFNITDFDAGCEMCLWDGTFCQNILADPSAFVGVAFVAQFIPMTER